MSQTTSRHGRSSVQDYRMVPSTNNPGPSPARAIAGRVVRLALGLAVAAASVAPLQAPSRLKDIAQFQGTRDNMPLGNGPLACLTGTGARPRTAGLPQQATIGLAPRPGGYP